MLNARTLKDWLLTSLKGKATPAEITSQHIVSHIPLVLVSWFFFCRCLVYSCSTEGNFAVYQKNLLLLFRFCLSHGTNYCLGRGISRVRAGKLRKDADPAH